MQMNILKFYLSSRCYLGFLELSYKADFHAIRSTVYGNNDLYFFLETIEIT